VIVTDEAFDELLDRLQLLESSVQSVDVDVDLGEIDDEAVEQCRRRFALAVDRAMKNVVTRKDRRIWYTQTLKRHGCRLHFVRSGGRIHLIACSALEDDDEDYAT
jgi:hypothetical protein